MCSDKLKEELREICSAVQIYSAEEFSFRGEAFHATPEEKDPAEFEFFKAVKPDQELHTDLINRLRNVLYDKCYVRKLFDVDSGVADAQNNSEQNLSSLFQNANHNKDGWDPGWCIYKTAPDGKLFVQKGERSRMVIAGEYSTYKWPGVAPAPGDMLSVRMFAGSAEVQPSFFFAFGRTLSDQFDECAVVRFYFNIKAAAAVELMRLLTTTLNRYLIPFKFKSLVNPQDYTRADSAVLYVARRYYHVAASIVQDVAAQLGDGLRKGTPMFTQTLVNGIGMADDPAGGESFGMHRCRLVAAAIVAAWQAGSQELEPRLAGIQEQFASFGGTLDAPYLNPQACNIFDQTIFSQEQQW